MDNEAQEENYENCSRCHPAAYVISYSKYADHREPR